jgi:tetratricopeptide (TPR) repeat protein
MIKPLVRLVILTLIAVQLPAWGQVPQATITEGNRTFRTYPFGDPDPVPRMGSIYPYFRFQGYTAKPVDTEWHIVTLENPYIRVFIAPEIGGKILGAIEKKSGEEFIYFNKVVKFREIAMRGPWTSGGVEFNFGDIGHAPTTSSPVDYLTRKNPDGSVSCIVGAMDLASRTEWRVEVRLPADRAYVETRSFWYNPGDLSTTRYHWMNGAADARDDLEYIYPGSAFIGHDGEVSAWPIDPTGRDLSRYRNNAFGSYKSYHVLGKNTDFFGVRWASKNLGVLHWSRYADKPGKKIWIWGLSREGEIWRNLLTDADLGNGQYTEIQSGIHFNQPLPKSSVTPFKHMNFLPSTAEQFTECWFPFVGLKNVVAANPYGALDVERNGSALQVSFCPLGAVTDTLIVCAGGKVLRAIPLRLRPLEPYTVSVPLTDPQSAYTVNIGGSVSFASDGESSSPLERPLSPDPFDWTSAYGLSVEAREQMRQRDYDGALQLFCRSLERDPSYLPSLSGAAELSLRRFDTDGALGYTRRALAIDAYDPDANYLYGLAELARGRYADAEDGFGIAARSAALRAAASIQLAEMAFMRGLTEEAHTYAQQAVDADRYAVRALRLLAIIERVGGHRDAAERVLGTITGLDPLSHFAHWESYLNRPDAGMLARFKDGVRNELPYESYLEVASVYLDLGLYGDGLAVLRQAPAHPMVHLWTAYLLAKTGQDNVSRDVLHAALQESSAFVFPYRSESEPVLRWAEKTEPHWKIRYFLAMLYWSRGRNDLAHPEFAACGTSPDVPEFYLARGSFLRTDSVAAEADLRKALSVGPDQWRTYQALTEFLASKGRIGEARSVAAAGAARFPGSYVLVLSAARTLIMAEDYAASRAILDTLTILPFEGARYGRDVHRHAYVMSAIAALRARKTALTRSYLDSARTWPERLGSGKPYDTDDRLEDYIEALACEKNGDAAGAAGFRRKVVEYTEQHASADRVQHIIGALSLRAAGKEREAQKLLTDWRSRAPAAVAPAWARMVFDRRDDAAQTPGTDAASALDRWSGDPEIVLVGEALRGIGIH